MKIDIYHHITQYSDAQIQLIIKQGEDVMATVQELKDKFVALGQTILAEKTEAETVAASLKVELQTLKDQLASGVLVTQADLDALALSVDDLIVGVKSIVPPTV